MVRLEKKKYATKHRNSARVEGPEGSLNRLRNRTCFWLQEDLECSETRFSTGQGIALFQDTLNRKELKSPEDRRKKAWIVQVKMPFPSCVNQPPSTGNAADCEQVAGLRFLTHCSFQG